MKHRIKERQAPAYTSLPSHLISCHLISCHLTNREGSLEGWAEGQRVVLNDGLEPPVAVLEEADEQAAVVLPGPRRLLLPHPGAGLGDVHSAKLVLKKKGQEEGNNKKGEGEPTRGGERVTA